MPTYDVAIIGAGPAGTLAGRDCAELGLNTVILEEDSVIGEPVHCGECLSAFAAANTRLTVPDAVISRRVRGVRVVFPDHAAKSLIEDGYVLDKAAFERWLADEAWARGATIKLGWKVTGMARDGDMWRLTSRDDSVAATLVIDASGVQSVTNALLQIHRPFNYIVGVQYEIDGVDTDGFIDFYLWPSLAAEGYLWVIPKSGGVSNVGLITTAEQKMRPLLQRFLERLGIQNHRVNKKFGGKIPASGPFPALAGDGLMLVGDAAGLTSPLFEGGTHLALKSAQFAAQTAKAAIDSGKYGGDFLASYDRMCRREFPDYARIIKGREKLYRFSEAQLNTIASYLPHEIEEFPFRDKIVSALRVLWHNPELIFAGIAPTLKAFELSRARSYGW